MFKLNNLLFIYIYIYIFNKMNFILTCESCEQRFNEADRQPVILPDCGHTFCDSCI
jgi:rRNA maturation endonuclease Nob1